MTTSQPFLISIRNLSLLVLCILTFTHCQQKYTISKNEEVRTEKETIEINEQDNAIVIKANEAILADPKKYPFIQEQNYITPNINSEDINEWILARVQNAKNGNPELVQIPVRIVDSVCGKGCALYKISGVQNSSELVWIALDIDEYTDVHLMHIIGYFTGEQSKYLSTDEQSEYHPYNFKYLKIAENEQSDNNNLNQSPHFVLPKIITTSLYHEIGRLHNTEFYEYSVLYDAKEYDRIYPDLPKAQHALLHKESQIEVLFKGFTFPPNSTQQAFVQSIQEDKKKYAHIIEKYNLKENWYFFEGKIPDTEEYVIFKKWFFDASSWTFTIEMKVHQNQLDLTHQILLDFDSQIVPEIK